MRLLCVAVLLAACSGGPVAAVPSSTPLEQVLRVNLAAAPVSLDPARVQYPQERAVLRQLGEPLLRPLPGLSGVEGAAAERYEVSADRLTYTFHLRAARYRDGLPVRAADFVYAWRRLLDPRVASPSADLFAASVRGGEEVAS
ncbi:MAG TPA: ABC transporter substrate-binding protein, partial [Candidatus Acidoferrales bacterium]|nr:ABC transporter substrate-binding protein [Candidatus Acidoferrales bacterium]